MWICSGLIRLYPDNIGHRKRTFVFRHIFLSLLNADIFRVHAYILVLLVYSYKCNWDLQYIHRQTHHPLHCMPPPPFNYWFSSSSNPNTEHTAQYNRSGLVTVSPRFILPACQSRFLCILQYQRFKLRATQAQMWFPSLHDQSISSSETLVKLGHVFLQCVYIINVIVNLWCLELL